MTANVNRRFSHSPLRRGCTFAALAVRAVVRAMQSKQRALLWIPCAAALIASAACVAEDSEPRGPDVVVEVDFDRDGPGEIEADVGDGSVEGSFSVGEARLSFTSAEVEPGVIDVEVIVNGMALTATVDKTAYTSQLDGFAVADGSTTTMRQADRTLLLGLGPALETVGDREEHAALDMLIRLASLWSQQPDGIPLQQVIEAADERGWESWCSSMYQWKQTTHDCDHCNAWGTFSEDNGCYNSIYVGYQWGGREQYGLVAGGPFYEGIATHAGPHWRFAGNCFGHCGTGCPSGNQVLSKDCASHDHCVRNGNHYLASFWCDDELAGAVDDKLYAPTCANTARPSINYGGVVDKSTQSKSEIRANGTITIHGKNFGTLGGSGGSNVVNFRRTSNGQRWSIGVGSYQWSESRFRIDATAPSWTGETCASVWAHGYDTSEVCFTIKHQDPRCDYVGVNDRGMSGGKHYYELYHCGADYISKSGNCTVTSRSSLQTNIAVNSGSCYVKSKFGWSKTLGY